jgi:DNA-binding IclR family transcriptional regulator
MFGTRLRAVATVVAVLELGIGGWYLGQGARPLLLAVAVVATVDCTLGMLRRGIPADLTGLALVAMLALAALGLRDSLFTTAVGLACAAWLVRPERQGPLPRTPAARAAATRGGRRP